MAQSFDPYAIAPDFASQGGDVVTAWKQALAKLNFQKNSVMDKYGFNSEGDVTNAGVRYEPATLPDGTPNPHAGEVIDVKAGGGMQGVTNFSDFAGKDNKSGFGGFRDELNAETNMLDRANNGPSRGFSGGLANQANAAAQQAAARRQQGFTSDYNQFAAGVNQSGLETTNSANSNLFGISGNSTNWKTNEASWQSTQPVYTPGVSGGGSTPIGARGAAVSMANSLAINPRSGQVFRNTGVTGTHASHYRVPQSTAKPPPPRGGHAL